MLLVVMKMARKNREEEEREIGEQEEEILVEKVVITSEVMITTEVMIQIIEEDREDLDNKDHQPLSQMKMVTLISKL